MLLEANHEAEGSAARRRSWPAFVRRAALISLAVFVPFFVFLTIWLWWTVPIGKSAEPIVRGRIELLARDGKPFAYDGVIMDEPVAVKNLPRHVTDAFYAIEDRRFRSHFGVDPISVARALWTGYGGGSTITQQLVKNAYLIDPETGKPYPGYSRKLREMAIAMWLELWLTKDEILERYLSMVQFGKNVYGLRAASLHYFYRQPERLTVPQAIMLAGLVQAPSRYDPVTNEANARKRAVRVGKAMQDAGFLPAGPNGLPAIAELDVRIAQKERSGFYFADWMLGEARAQVGRSYKPQQVATTLDSVLQQAAQDVARDAPVPGAQVALVAMRPNGEVAAMIGGRNYTTAKFNIAVDGRRQPGSTFKLFTYVAALQKGMRPGSTVSNAPITSGDYRPGNGDGQYGGAITLTEAFARSSNVAAVRLFEKVGPDAVIDIARAFGITDKVEINPSLALGTAETSLLSMTAAYAGIAAGEVRVTPFGLLPPAGDSSAAPQSEGEERTAIDPIVLGYMRAMMAEVITSGTGKAAQLPVPAYGKTGTTQNNRDAWFIGYAGKLVVGVWLGTNEGTANKSLSGGDAAAKVWRAFMLRAIAADKLAMPRAPTGGAAGAGVGGGVGDSALPGGSELRGDDGRAVAIPPPPAIRSGAGAASNSGGVSARQIAAGSSTADDGGIGFEDAPTPLRPGENTAPRQTAMPGPGTGGQYPQRPLPPQRVQGRLDQRAAQRLDRRRSPSSDEDEDFTIECGDESC
jgi:penicillin-binding protein 1A